MSARPVTVTKYAAEVVRLRADVGERVVPLRRPRTTYAVGDVAQPSTPNGWFLECVKAGATGVRAPSRWPTDRPIIDGGVTWEPRPLGHASLPTVTAPATWTASTTLTVSSSVVAGYVLEANVAGGVLGGRYLVEVRASVSDGRIVAQAFELEVLRP